MDISRRQFLNFTGLGLLVGMMPTESLAKAKQANATKSKSSKSATSASSKNSSLGQRVNQYLTNQRRKGRLSKNERSAWAVSDLHSGRDLVSLNATTPLQCASMVKPFVALAYLHAHHRVSAKKYPLGAREKRLMSDMLARSSNQATNALMKVLGGPAAVQSLLKRNYGSIFQQTHIVEMIPLGGQTYRNKASAQDYNRFLKALWGNKFPASAYLKSVMSLPNRDRVRDGTKYVPRSAKVYDKTGTTAMLCGNMAIVACVGKNKKLYPYTITGIIERRGRTGNLGRWSRERGNLIRDVSDMVYLDFAKRYPLS
ncbi:MAG: serine hydrolase [Cardiobacteriaceae bacterium]|nr:serine hydrolase [Cardiobacteriaceae bacterium]